MECQVVYFKWLVLAWSLLNWQTQLKIHPEKRDSYIPMNMNIPGHKCNICEVHQGDEVVKIEKIIFHRFPLEADRCRQWLEVVGRESLKKLTAKQLRGRYVCSRHFWPASYPGPLSKILYSHAVPDRSVPAHASGPCPARLLQPAAVIQSTATATPAVVISTSSMLTSTTASTTTITTSTYSTTTVTSPIPSTSTSTAISPISSHSHIIDKDNAMPRTVEFSQLPEQFLEAEALPGPSVPIIARTQLAQHTPPKRRGALSLIGARTYKEITPRKRKLCKRILIQKRMLQQLRKKCRRVRQGKKEDTDIATDNLITALNDVFSRNPTFAALLGDLIKNVSKLGKGRRWSPTAKAIALGLFKRSPSCYRLLQKMIHMPSRRTLIKLLNTFHLPTGIGKVFYNQLAARVATMADTQKICSLIFDEMSLSAGLHYNRGTDQIDGYEDYGHLGRTSRVADHALVFMVCGLLRKWKQPVAYYFCKGTVPTEKLKVLIKEVIRALQKVGLEIVATVCDQGPTNVRAIRELCSETRTERPGPFFKVGGKEIVTIFDPPHLLKTTRNNVFRHGVIFAPGEKAEWKHVVRLFKIDSRRSNRSCPKLTKDHVEPKGYRAMRVNLAAQVFSSSVAANIECMLERPVELSQITLLDHPYLDAEAKHFGKFCKIMDQLMDSFNGRTKFPEDGKKLRCWLTNDSAHLKFWSKMIRQLSKWKFPGSSTKVAQGWINDIRAVQMLWKKLSQRGVEGLCVRNLNQDPAENLFGVIRQHGCQNTNPTCWQFVPALKTSIINNLLSSKSGEGGNCEDDNRNLLCDLSHFLTSATFPSSTFSSEQDAQWFSAEVDSMFTSAYKHCGGMSQLPTQGLNIQGGQDCSAAYVAGYLARKVLCKFSCPACKSSLISPSPLPEHRFIQLKENDPEDPKLVLPSSMLTTHVSVVTEILLSKLEECANETHLLQMLKAFIISQYEWTGVGCDIHGSSVVEELVAVLCLMWLYHFGKRKNVALRHHTGDGSAPPDRFDPAAKKMNILLHK